MRLKLPEREERHWFGTRRGRVWVGALAGRQDSAVAVPGALLLRNARTPRDGERALPSVRKAWSIQLTATSTKTNTRPPKRPSLGLYLYPPRMQDLGFLSGHTPSQDPSCVGSQPLAPYCPLSSRNGGLGGVSLASGLGPQPGGGREGQCTDLFIQQAKVFQVSSVAKATATPDH